jgi:HD-GYP domain-containing protein (c-di-GMP phosphodiesterase class II)
VTEFLLADRARDLVPRAAGQQPDPAFKFKMEVPEHLYNHGELYNLSIERGTLTPEERFKINEHMVHTIMMLERMPFPKHLRRVPEYAGTHHERIDGKGYPRQLAASELSIPSRIMAVADIFEALTASDRPYKKPKKLSEALAVLQRMAGRHIDADVFDLFISSGIFLDYARKHLDEDQIDVIDGSPYLSRVPHG